MGVESLGKSPWRNVCAWEGQAEEAISSRRSGKNKGVEVEGRIPVFASIRLANGFPELLPVHILIPLSNLQAASRYAYSFL